MRGRRWRWLLVIPSIPALGLLRLRVYLLLLLLLLARIIVPLRRRCLRLMWRRRGRIILRVMLHRRRMVVRWRVLLGLRILGRWGWGRCWGLL